MLHVNPQSAFQHDIPAADYDIIRKVIEHISVDYREQPSLEDLADETGLEATALQKLFTRWAGLSPKAFLQAVTMDHARRLLDDGLPLLDAAYEVGLSGPSRLHDLFVTHEAMSPGDFKTRGGGLTIRCGFHPSPFGMALIMTTERGICGLAFANEEGEEAALKDMTRRWPDAVYVRDDAAAAAEASLVFDPSRWSADKPLRIVLIGTDFQIKVWKSLLEVPMGKATTYGTIAQKIGAPKASRAVGAAVGANPISFVVPCHRAVGATGALTGYHWGLTRKRAMLGWEAGQVLRA
jgi:AraC family transcriptional regulator, regulatory protein of adaptative response / methylated-DNA-[protein]-cysteine methyltransferase